MFSKYFRRVAHPTGWVSEANKKPFHALSNKFDCWTTQLILAVTEELLALYSPTPWATHPSITQLLPLLLLRDAHNHYSKPATFRLFPALILTMK